MHGRRRQYRARDGGVDSAATTFAAKLRVGRRRAQRVSCLQVQHYWERRPPRRNIMLRNLFLIASAMILIATPATRADEIAKPNVPLAAILSAPPAASAGQNGAAQDLNTLCAFYPKPGT